MATAKKSIATVPASIEQLELIKQDDRWLLRQGQTVLDITSIVVSANYQVGRLTLGIREARGQ